MNPARLLAVRVLRSVLQEGAFAAPALDGALGRARLSARDAGLATHIVYGTLRWLPALEVALAPLLRANTPMRARSIVLAGAFEKLYLETPAHAVVSEYVELAKQEVGRLSGLVNAVLRRVERPDSATDEVRYGLPGWLADEFRAAYGERAAGVLEDQTRPAPLWLWLSDAGIRDLEDEGSVVEPGYGDVFRVSLDRPLRETRAFQRGQAQPVNPASHAVVSALGDLKDRRVLDLAGGSGVKAAFLALAGARVISYDLDARKHEAARGNFRRLHLEGEFKQADLAQPQHLEAADVVLLDAPCTGSGTLRAHPEIKLRLTPAEPLEMAELQRRMLETAAAGVAPGGTLLYSVCSLTHAEGPGVLEAFLADHPEFTPQELALEVPAVPAGAGAFTVADHGLDGFFVARLQRD
ncbi:16S rRNA (cytosine967-C5)-methyltransferase [Deinobacterium chartae]|uniref:16S rRNA (Cytosine967-C5)-methyltransferase n=1 Tax=Deinobacterium chartae TaxID=521158 RepID=A0A841I1V6_9DEIO|nr:transcription antitermination factor NusB [Deinobacterium chartae]MBB6098400.1 16S rRNA (cytosine967-C5)-methyltransferase [Deinobacterium chartae]